MTPPAPITHGLSGKITETSWTPPSGMTLEEWGRSLKLLGRMSFGLSWWLADALVWGDEHAGEKMATYADETGLAPHSIQNLLWVGKSVPRSRRREALSFSHHEAVAALSPAIQEVWLEKAERGESLPGGGSQRWSVTRLRTELRALKPKKEVEHVDSGPSVPDSGAGADPAMDLPVPAGVARILTQEPAPVSCPLAIGCILDIPNFGRAEVTAISVGPVAALVTLVHAK